MADIVDLRSDTVTKPSPEMRRAIAEAEVGDDVLGDDPTVIRLQERMSELLGMEDALFVPSGSMANQVAIRSVTEPGDEIICHKFTHSYNYEAAGPAALCGCSMRFADGPRGIFDAQAAEPLVQSLDSHCPHSRMLIIENTNNNGGGAVWPVEKIAALREVAKRHGLHTHIDGARLMNASVAAGCKPTDYTQHVDSVSLCFSKGLGAPIGSIVAGSSDFIKRAHRFRKMFGGGMRQAGILAAAALYAIDNNIERLAEDHDNARHLAESIAEMPGISVDVAEVETNIVMFEIDERLGTNERFAKRLWERGVWTFTVGPKRIRAVTHMDVSRERIDRAIAVFRDLCASPQVA
jgi:threonine aldolase